MKITKKQKEFIDCVKQSRFSYLVGVNHKDDNIDKLIKENMRLNNIIDKANELLSNIVVVKNDGTYRPVKNTTSQEVYKTICMLNELLKTPNRANYNLLQGSDKE